MLQEETISKWARKTSNDSILDNHIENLAEITASLRKIIAAMDRRRSTPVLSAAYVPQKTTTALTKREKEILTWVAIGKTDPEISQLLKISRHTVNMHLRHIYEKIGANSRILAVTKALVTGLVDIKLSLAHNPDVN